MQVNRRKILLDLLDESLVNLNKSIPKLETSFEIIISNPPESDIYEEKLKHFEIIPLRFARSSDILTQKVLRTLFSILLDEPRTFIDSANLAEKYNLIDSSNDLINIRELRNRIAHEYEDDKIIIIYKDLIDLIPLLIKTVKDLPGKIEDLNLN